MIEISLGKLMLLALIALIVLGPEKLPHAARTAGALVRRLRSGWESVRAEVERELEIEELKRTAREAAERADALQADMNKAARDTREQFATTAAGVRSAVTDVQTEIQTEIAGTDTPKDMPHESAPHESTPHGNA
jgi:sec-independent protein translocase protein TatB